MFRCIEDDEVQPRRARSGLVTVLPEFLEFALNLADFDRDTLGEEGLVSDWCFGDSGYRRHNLYRETQV